MLAGIGDDRVRGAVAKAAAQSLAPRRAPRRSGWRLYHRGMSGGEPDRERELHRDVTTTSRFGKWFFSGLAIAQLAMFVPLVPEVGPGILLAGVPGAVIAAGLLLWYGVIRTIVTTEAVVVQKGLRERRIPLDDIASVEVQREAAAEAYMMGTARDRSGNESFGVYGSHRAIRIALRSGPSITVMSDAPDVVAGAIESARASATVDAAARAPAPRVRVGSEEEHEPDGEDARDREARAER